MILYPSIDGEADSAENMTNPVGLALDNSAQYGPLLAEFWHHLIVCHFIKAEITPRHIRL